MASRTSSVYPSASSADTTTESSRTIGTMRSVAAARATAPIATIANKQQKKVFRNVILIVRRVRLKADTTERLISHRNRHVRAPERKLLVDKTGAAQPVGAAEGAEPADLPAEPDPLCQKAGDAAAEI